MVLSFNIYYISVCLLRSSELLGDILISSDFLFIVLHGLSSNNKSESQVREL